MGTKSNANAPAEESSEHLKMQAQSRSKTALQERKNSPALGKRQIVADMLRDEVEVAVLGHTVLGPEGDRVATWRGPKKFALQRRLAKTEIAKKKALNKSLQEFLTKESYGKIPDDIQAGTHHISQTDDTMTANAMTPVEKLPRHTDSIVTKGVAIWMKGIATVLTGQGQDVS